MKSDQIKLLDWYKANHRDLPWRKSRDPYRIWISEVMLQQTTTVAVLGFYDRFMEEFPDLKSLARAPLTKVYKKWAGLGYYSRARNLHKAAKKLVKLKTFPKTHFELLEYPGFGPYTARAVSSLAFSEPVGVLDGNVIRVLSRKTNDASAWWASAQRNKLQNCVDEFVAGGPSHILNQALMELGAQVCTPGRPHCHLCPWQKSCLSLKEGTTLVVPLRKPRKESEIWLWMPQVMIQDRKILFQKNNYAPFLKNDWFLPGEAEKLTIKPEQYHYRHRITHHDIYVRVEQINSKSKHKEKFLSKSLNSEKKWVDVRETLELMPASLIQKALKHVLPLFLCTIIVGALFLTSCQTTSVPKSYDLKAPQNYVLPTADQITNSGESYNGRFSEDGKKVLYISRKRLKHDKAQVYELDLQTKKDQRMTYDDGEITDAEYAAHQKFYYASTTDEIKETPRFLKSPSDALPETEIYLSSRGGNDILRLTNSEGFDGEMSVSASGSKLIFVTVRNKLKRLFNLNSNSKTVSSVFSNLSEHIDDESPAFSPDGKQIVWVRTDKSKLGQSEIWISDNNLKNPHVLVSAPSKIYANPSWHPNKNDILFAADAAPESPADLTATSKPQNIEIYAIRKDGSCLRRITFNTADDRMPRVSPDGSQLLFTSNRAGVLQLYLMNYQPPPCPQN